MLKASEIQKYVLNALKEDHFRQDITSQIFVPPHHRSRAVILVKNDGILCGLPLVKETFRLADKTLQFRSKYRDGMAIKKGSIIASITGKTRSLLCAERTALNFLSYLSGIASQTHQYVTAVKPYKSKILDTRKTTPTLRHLEKYAVKCGGGENHRLNLEAMILIKDNHWAANSAQSSIESTIKKIRKRTNKKIEIEIDHLDQLPEVLKSNPDFILLDNMTPAQLKKAVEIVKQSKLKIKPLLEASGGVTLRNVNQIAMTGIDRISVGALTHYHSGLDVSMEIKNEKTK